MGPGCFEAASAVTGPSLEKERVFYHQFTLLNPNRRKARFLQIDWTARLAGVIVAEDVCRAQIMYRLCRRAGAATKEASLP
jgi:hypothetical protein